MSTRIYKILYAFGELLNVTARGKTETRKTLDEMRMNISVRQDKLTLLNDFKMIGDDISVAMRQENDSKQINSNV